MINLRVNGRGHTLEAASGVTLAGLLRQSLGLLGVRVSCAEGECGSCTVLVDGRPVTSCLMLAAQAEGKEVTTIEALASSDDGLHPIQQAFIDAQAFQCGFCTPGFILTAKAFLEENTDPTPEEAAVAMSGNICRCGSYPYIVDAVVHAGAILRERGAAEGS